MLQENEILLTMVTSEIDAQLIIGLLRGAGLFARLEIDDCGGMNPQLQLSEGVGVVVEKKEYDVASAILAQNAEDN